MGLGLENGMSNVDKHSPRSKTSKGFYFGLISSVLILIGFYLSRYKYRISRSKSNAQQENINGFPSPEPNHGNSRVLPPVKQAKFLFRIYIPVILAVFFALLSLYLFSIPIPSIYPWLFHLASIVVLIVSILRLDRKRKQEGSEDESWKLLEIGIFVAILALAALMRLYRFDQIPFGTWYDEADNGLIALKILIEPGYLPVFAESTNLPSHFLYMIALSFRIFGISTLSIRAVSVFFGLVTVAAAYLTGRELFNRKMGLIIAFFLAISRWDINWSRIGMHGVTVPFFELLSVGLLLRALRRQRLIDYTLAGLSIGLGLCFYTPLRLFPVVVVIFLVVLWFNRHSLNRASWHGILVLCLGFGIASTPVIYLITFQPDSFFSRMQTVSIFAGKTPLEDCEMLVRRLVNIF